MPTVYLHSIGQMACMAETPVPEVQRILDKIGAKPAFVINLIPHYGADVLGTLIARVKNWSNLPAFHKTFFDEIQANA